MSETITSLIEKLEGAEVGSRELDGDVLKATGHGYHMDFGNGWYARPGHNERIYGNGPSQVTTSLDAALALAERMLPGWVWMVERHKDGRATVWLHEFSAYGEGDTTEGNTPALALCAAILRAHQHDN